MIVVAGLLILVAGALLVGGLGNGQTALLWGSVGVSALAALALITQSVQRRRATAAAEPAAQADPAAEAEPAARTEPAAEAEPAAVGGGGPAAGEPVAAEIAALRAELAELRSGRSAHAAPSTGAEATPAESAADEPTPAEPAAVVPAPAGPSTATPTTAPADADDEPAPAPAGEPAHRAEAGPAAPAARTSSDGPGTGTHAVVRPIVLGEDGEPVEEDVVVTDLLLVIDLTDEVFVVDEHPRYHLDGCAVTEGQDTFGLPLDEAKGDGFTACGICRPDRSLADAERQRRAAARS